MATNKKATKGKAPLKTPAKEAAKPGRFAKAKNFVKDFIGPLKKETAARKKSAAKPASAKPAAKKSKASASKKVAKPAAAKKVAPVKAAATKKAKSKATPAKGSKAAPPKAPRATAPVKKQSTKPVAAKSKAPEKKLTNKQAGKTDNKQPATPVVTSHGSDLHLIPVKGEINPSGTHDSKINEQAYRHHSDTLMHQENMRAKAALATRKHAKAVFRNFRQS